MIAPDLLKRATAAGVMSVAVVGGMAAFGSGVVPEAEQDLTTAEISTSDRKEPIRREVHNQPVLRRAPRPDGMRDSPQSDRSESSRSLSERNRAANRALGQLEELERPEESSPDEAAPELTADKLEELREMAEVAERLAEQRRESGLDVSVDSARTNRHREVDAGRAEVLDAIDRATRRSQAGDFPVPEPKPSFGGANGGLDPGFADGE